MKKIFPLVISGFLVACVATEPQAPSAASVSSSESSITSSSSSSAHAAISSSQAEHSSMNAASSENAQSSSEHAIVWVHCADENKRCHFEGESLVRYGAGDIWVEQTLANGTLCSNTIFDDPTPQIRKTCQVPNTTELLAHAEIPDGYRLWSDPASWTNGVPAKGSRVIVTSDQKVLLDQDVELYRLQIDGELICAEQDLNITANAIMVHGKMACGTAEKSFLHALTITLTGDRPANVDTSGNGMGTKVLGVMMGGQLHLHGEERTSWLQLNETANAGAQTLQLSDAPNWRAGDKLVITSTAQDYKQAEVVTIASINGNSVTLRSPLKHRHYGEIQYFNNERRTWEVDTRAEVGLLTRNIKVVGDAQSGADKYGAHIMVMARSFAYLSGLEMTRVGQYGIKGRYPFHWHLTGDAAGQYIKKSAIYDSWNRCITVHGTHNTQVENNVCFKHVGHGFFLEDGIEQGNTFHRNLGLWTIRPPENDALIASDFETGPASQGPATYWISNGDNTFTENVAAGSDGLSYWYDTEDSVTGPSANLAEAEGYSPRKSPFAKFKGNRAHSSRMALSLCSRSAGRPGYDTANNNGALIEDFTVYFGGMGAIWPCNKWHRFDNIKVTDTGLDTGINFKRAAFVSAFPASIDDSLFVSNSALAEGVPKTRSAFGIYDFGTLITNSHFVNYNAANAKSSLFSEVGGAVTFLRQGVENITLDNSDLYLQVNGVNSKATTGNIIRDYDGSLANKAGRWSLVPKNDLMKDASCEQRPSPDHGSLCPYYYGQILINTGSINNLPTVKVTRTDLQNINKAYQPHENRKFYKVFAPLNCSQYHHVVNFEDGFTGRLAPLSKITLRLEHATSNDTSMIAFRHLKENARIAKAGWLQVNSLAALRSHDGRAWFKSGDVFHVKFKASHSESRTLGATDSVDILLN